MIDLTHEPIDTAQLLARVGDRRAGAIVLFVGVTREFTDDRQTAHLEYECYPEMAQTKLEELVSQVRER
ncbi:MAG: molybdenum cofactor biosynthesis protein MoaE, partial [Pirellulaceae bacterium]